MAQQLGVSPRVRIHMVSMTEDGDALSGDAKIFFNEFQVYGFSYAAVNIKWALERVGEILERLRNLDVDVAGREAVEKLLGRRIYYREQPAVVEYFDGVSGQIRIRCDNGRTTFEPEPWDTDPQPQYRLDVDILDAHIFWDR